MFGKAGDETAMNKEAVLTVIVPVYQVKESYLRRCIESLLAQEGDAFRVLLVDDGSPDQCGGICDAYAEADARVSVIHQENQGVSAARNAGIRAARTGWISFVDADDWVEEDYFRTLTELVTGPADRADIVLFEYSREYRKSRSEESLGFGAGYVDGDRFREIRRKAIYKVVHNGKSNPFTVIAAWNKVYRTEFLREKGIEFARGVRKGEDLLFNVDALYSADRLYYLPRLLYRYRYQAESRTNRYDPDIVKMTETELLGLQRAVEKRNLGPEAEALLQCRICTRLYSCMRLYFFHPLNAVSSREKIKEARRLAESPLYAEALRKVDLRRLNRQERFFTRCLKRRQYRLLYLLVRVRSAVNEKRHR